MAQLSALLDRPGLVTVTGPGGVGKTRLAREVAATYLDGQSDAARWLVDVEPIADPPAILPAAPGGPGHLGIGPGGIDELAARLGGRRLVVVLDSCEHLVDACARLADCLVGRCASLTLVSTTRQPLGVPGEAVLRLAPLSIPSEAASLGALEHCDAVRLFVQRLGSPSTLPLTDDEASLVGRICRATEGIPLDIENAARAAAAMDLRSLAEALEAGIDPGPYPWARTSGRTTLASNRERSWPFLTLQEGRLLRRLSVFVGGWSLDAARHVCAGEGLSAEEIAGAHQGLVAKSLVLVDPEDPSRHRMLTTTRRVGWRLDGGESAWLARSHAQWCLSLVADAADEPLSLADEAWLGRLDPERDNLRAALAWARDGGDAQLGVVLVSALVKYWVSRAALHEALAWVTWAMSQDAEAMTPPAHATLTLRASVVHSRLGNGQMAMELAEQAGALYRAAGDHWGAAEAGRFTSLAGRPHVAVRAFDDDVDRARAASKINHLAHLLRSRGQALFFSGQLGAARSDFDECVRLGRRPGRSGALVPGLLGLARVDLAVGNYPAAARELDDALSLARQAGDRPSQSIASALWAELCRLRGDHGRSRALLEAAIDEDQAAGETLAVARGRLFLGRLEQVTGACDTARALFGDALDLGRAAKAPPYHEARCLLGLAAAHLGTAELGRAQELAEQAGMVASANDDRQASAQSLHLLARVGRARGGDSGEGIRQCQKALKLYEAVDDRPGITTCVEDVAALFADRGWYELSAQLLGAAGAMREVGGYARPPLDRDSYDRVATATAEALGDRWEQARLHGRTLSPTEAVATVHDEPARRPRASKGWASLTPAERRVARLVSEGLTSDEVAMRLFVSRRTVENHLGHVYAKLGIHTRKELGNWSK